MALLVRRQRRIQQPQQAAGIDWANPITRGLVFAFSGSAQVNEVTGRPGAGSAAKSGTRLGVAADFNGSSPPLTWPASLSLASAVSGHVVVNPRGTVNTNIFLLAHTPGSGYIFFDLSGTESNDPLRVFQTPDNVSAGATYYDNPPAGVLHSYTPIWRSGPDNLLYRDGVLLTPRSAGQPVGKPGVTEIAVGWVQTDAAIPFAALWNRELSAAEAASLSRNPWQVFAPRRIWVPASAGGGGASSITVSDTASGVEQLLISAGLVLSDAGTGAEAFGNAAALQIGDSAAGADALSAAAALAIADFGAGVDLVAAVSVQVLATDLGAAVDQVLVAASSLVSVSDAGSGTDALALVAQLQVADAAAGTDVPTVGVQLLVPDSGAGVDGATLLVQLSVADLGGATEVVSLLSTTLKQVVDSGLGADQLQVLASVQLSETGAGTDALGIAAALQVLQQALGVDAVLRFESTTRVALIRFTLAQRRVAFLMRSRRLAIAWS